MLTAALGAFLLLVLPPTSALALKERILCDVCRRYVTESPGMCQVRIEGEKHTKSIQACSPFCLFELLEDNRLEGEQSFMMIDYTSRNDDVPLMIGPRQATCLFEVKCDEEDMHEPCVFYFASEDDARAAQKELGGRLLSWDSVALRCRALASEYEPEKDNNYRPLKKRARSKAEKKDDG